MAAQFLPWIPKIAALVPIVFVTAALSASPNRPFHAARAATGAAIALTVALIVGWLMSGGSTLSAAPTGGLLGVFAPTVRMDAVTAVMLSLITFVGFVLVRFSRRYLDGDPGCARYASWMMATLASVTVLVIANNLLWLGAAWVCTSLALHQLLTFYRDRPQALIAAHKKFLVSRIADVSLLGGIALLGSAVGSYELDVIQTWAEGHVGPLPISVHAAAVLFVLGASLKCAQLPFHGWLTQVMEAPTPVSALLHAGIVNIGGFLMIRLAPVMVHASVAQTLLVFIGTSTAVLAALVMETRPSVKVKLAWSTCAQMGFMLVQCGLGAYHLALLHLVAHSLYKAHAFLSSGSAVEQWRAHALAPKAQAPSLWAWFSTLPVAAIGVVAAASVYGITPSSEPALWAFGAVLMFALTPLLVDDSARSVASRVILGGTAFVVGLVYFGWSSAFGFAAPEGGDPSWLQLATAVLGFSMLFVVQAALRTRPDGQLARALVPVLRTGLYLDEIFTRITFRVWPAKLPSRERAAPLAPLETQEA